MTSPQFDVVIVGGGCAGMTAAIGLAKSGFSVAVVEAAAFPGAENWSGCVYFCENLIHPDILGPEGVAALAWERRLVERGFFATDGHGLLGLTYRDPAAFQHCYTVLRPIFDHHLALHAQQVGVVILNETTAESLIRDGTRVIGVCTQRGPLYADLVFLAEGDASHLVTREGYERHTDPREQPKFLHGIKQVIDLPPGAVEETFGVGAGEGVAYEMLLRNGTLRGKQVHLNMGGFVYTNRQSLSIGLVLPADHLHEHFEGDPNLLIEWFSQLPALQPWLKQGKRGVFGAKLIRGGGARDIPRLIDDGLAIGGAASGIGIDFPYPNFTGPATYMGLLLVQAARRIREEKSRFSLEKLQQHYLEPLQRCHYYQDVEFLRRWPAYVERTTVFFDRNIDLTLGTAYIWTRPGRWLPRRILNWVRLLWVQAGPAQWTELRDDGRQLMKALQVAEVVGRPSVWRLLLDGTVNALRDLFGSPRPYLPSSGQVRLHYATAGGQEPSGTPPGFIRRWGQRFLPVVAAAAAKVYANDREPLAGKLRSAVRLLMRQVNIMDVTAAGLLGLLIALAAAIMAAWSRLRSKLRQRPAGTVLGSDSRRYEKEARQATDMTAVAASAAQQWEGRLGHLAYETVKDSHISVLWPQALPDKNRAAKQGLWHVCPAHVYEARQNAQGQLQVIVNFENCIKCETCWRTSDMVDWGRDGNHRFIYPVHSPSIERLLPALAATATAQPRLPRTIDPWGAAAPLLREPRSAGQNGAAASEHAEILPLLDRLERKLEEFDESLAAEPRTIDKARAAYLEMLARYAQQLAVQLDERARSSDSPPLRALAVALTQKAEERSRRCAAGRYRWAAADGRQMRHHHLAGLRRLLPGQAMLPADPNQRWLAAERHGQASAALRAEWSARLDAVLPASTWRELDRRQPLSQEQDALLRELLARVPAIDPERLDSTLHPTARKVLLAELGRRDPSLAYRAAGHLWARDLAKLAAGASAALAKASKRWTKGEEWACFAAVAATSTREGWQGEVLFVPARDAQVFLLLVGDQLAVIDVPREPHSAGLLVEPLATLGLRGAGLARLRLDQFALPETRATVDAARILRAWNILSAADLTAIAFGMADVLCERAIAHAANRVQFPGLFHDEQSRDAIGKFGAVKKLLAEMAARRFLLETLDHVLSPADLSGSSLERAELVKATAADALGKLAYNAGQVFGGTGFSEDDILAKYYRDASAWRFLGPPNIEVWRRHGTALLHDWQADGQQLASLRGEAEVFDQVVQRKALQGELDAVRVVRGQLRGLVNDYLKPGVAEEQRPKLSPVALAEVGEGLARQDAQLLASKALLLRLHARLEHGLTSETELSLLRVWLNGVTAESLDFESCLRLHTTLTAPPVASPEGKALPRTYRDYLAAAAPYDSGDFLSKPLDLQRPRYVPEMIATDPNLSEADRRLRERISGWFGRPQDDGLPYERHIERRHRPSPEDLDYCRRAGFFRFPIPKELGGEGKSKAEYYLLTTGCQRLADVAISLTIQVSSSLGTTPVLLTRTKELPRAEKELAAFSADTSLQSQITSGLQNIRQLLDSGNPAAVKQAYLDLQKLLTATVLTSTAGKALLHRFLDAWQQAGRAGLAFDLAAMGRLLEQAARHWQDGCARAEDYRLEFGRRREAADLFLRWVASGQISGFALTEPSAGSDTARVATRAVLRAVPVERAADGVLKFIPQGGKEPRYLLDARQVEFRASPDNPELQPVYRWSAQAEPAPLRFDEYDYETDDPRRSRYYQHGERKVYFSDIAQLRERDGQLWYDYWELTGAKMWITNGRMMGVMCLYAKTDEGITGFIVDRHAEGLIVGKDEEKLGQCGSPTNELSLQAVRVPRENVIGIEGRGQVNALETLNVGRAGLAMSAMAQMAGLIEQSRVFAQAHYDGIPDWVGWRLQRMEAERFTSEALAHEVVGRFEHPQTKSVRLESAIAKMLVSEALHRVIALAEEIHGLAGQTQEHLVEKRKRDARVLNIYEGTNEIQRFFILKDLPVPDQSTAKDLQREAADLERLRQQVGQRLQSAAGYFGAEIWQNPNLQANCFLLSEAVAWFKAAESTLGRKQWIGSAEDAARRALLQCSYEVQNRLRHFDEEMVRLRRGFYAEEVRAASLLFRHEAAAQPITPPANRIIRPLAVLVVVEPSVAALPQPHVEDGRLVAAYWSLSPADRAAVETALQLRDAAPDHVEIQVAAVAPETAAGALRELLSVGVRRARLLVLPAGEVTPDSGAAALATALRPSGPFELVLGGSGTGQEEGLLARLTAEALGVHHAGSTAQLSVHWTDKEAEVRLLGSERRQRVRSLPMGLAIEPELKLRSFAVAGSLQGLSRNVEVERWPRKATARGVTLFEAMPAGIATADDAGTELNPRQAADRLLQELGHRAGAAGSQVAYRGDIEDVSGPGVLAGRVVALLGAGADGQLEPTASLTVRAASLVAETWNRELAALLLVSSDETSQGRAVGQLRAFYPGEVLLFVAEPASDLAEVRGRLLRDFWPKAAPRPGAVVGEPWTEMAFAALSTRIAGAGTFAARIRRLGRDGDVIVAETLRVRGKLRAVQRLEPATDRTCWLTLAADAEVAAPLGDAMPTGKVERWQPVLEQRTGHEEILRMLDEARAEVNVGRLADAEFIIDVGFGVGNRDAYDAVIEPLEQALRQLGVAGLMIGGSRKVTEELHLLPADRQIGQSGVSVNPRILLAIGVSGAPQHLNYIGSRTAILAFNRDPEAPIMTLNRRQPRPKVFPVAGDLFETVPLLIAALKQEAGQPTNGTAAPQVISR